MIILKLKKKWNEICYKRDTFRNLIDEVTMTNVEYESFGKTFWEVEVLRPRREFQYAKKSRNIFKPKSKSGQ